MPSACTILFTSDLHDSLTEHAAERLAALARERPGTLLLDGGDAIRAGNLTARKSEPILARMAALGYQAMAMGNRESHPMRGFLETKLQDATFPVLAANIRSKRGPIPAQVKPYLILTTPSTRVAVIGLAPEITRPSSAWSLVTDYVFEDPVATARELTPRLHAEADLVVCLSHCPHRNNTAVAALPEVDLVLAGHTHRAEVLANEGSALLVYAGTQASHAARIELSSRADARAELIPLEHAP
jgi:2',3'-cyclic-nucleotide 2'-phosphodiesterase (5'-nucleotidase family)